MNELYDFVITLRMVFIDFKALKSLATLNTRNVLINLTVLRVLILDALPPVDTT